jgi:transcriptional regulator with XRE-family HTH domain
MEKKFTDKEKKIIGENIWVRRILAGMSKEELANTYGVSKGMVNIWERGESVPVRKKVKELARILGCSAHELCRPYEIPKLSFTEAEKIKVKVKFEEEPVISDEELIKQAKEVFVNSYTDDVEQESVNYIQDCTNIEQIEQEEQKPEKSEKLSLSERLNGLYETLFTTLDELDKLKEDITKVEQVTAMLKEIQGL